MTVLTVLEWVMTSNSLITATVLITFTFSLLFLILRGKSK